LIKDIKPNEIYNLAALSHVQVSFTTPASVLDINTKGILNILDAVRVLGLEETTKIYQASSSEMFGSTPAPQNEQTPMNPCSPYGIAKLAAYHLVCVYRESYNLFVSNGILFNHESPLRGEDFVTKKITRSIAAIEAEQMDYMILGNLDSIRDWGHARDYIRGMWMMLQQDMPDDYVLATGKAHSVREFVERAFAYTGIQIKWQGKGLNEIGINAKTGKLLVAIDETLFRPFEVNHLLGDTQKAQNQLGWKPETDLDTLIKDMIDMDRQTIKTKLVKTNDDNNMAQLRVLS
jgi:GDPmannose 4,6-dehydratase